MDELATFRENSEARHEHQDPPMTTPHPVADVGFHSGELAVQRRAGVQGDAQRKAGMLEPVELSGGFAMFLDERTFLVVTGRDAAGRLWTSPLVGPPGFLEARSDTEVAVHAGFPAGDPLHGLAAGQKLGMTAIDFATRRRVRVNGLLAVAASDFLFVAAEQAFGNCPKYIQQRLLAPDFGDQGAATDPAADSADSADAAADSTDTSPADAPNPSPILAPEDIDLIRAADTFFLGTVHPGRGADASHRGGAPGFVRTDGHTLWWPDYPGNNLFTSLGNITVDPEAALLFFDFTAGRTLHLSGTAEIEWGDAGRPNDDGATGRIVRFTPRHVVAGRPLPARQLAFRPYPLNPVLID